MVSYRYLCGTLIVKFLRHFLSRIWWESGENNMKKLLNYVLTVYALLILGTASLAMAASSAVSWGNNSENILNGGVIAADASGRVYYADTDKAGALYVSYNGSKKLLSSDSASNINVIDNTVYYTAKNGNGYAVYSVTTGGKNREKIFSTSKTIKEMYVRSDGGFYVLANGKVYFKKGASAKSQVLAKGSITHFVPTAHGIIYAKGSKQNYTVYADGKKVSANVFSFYVFDNYLLFTKNKKDYQVSVHDLFSGSGSAKIQAYTLGSKSAALSNIAKAAQEDCECEECQANAKAAAAAGAIASAASRTDSAAAVSASASGITSIIKTDQVSQGQKNMVKRARQQHEIRWTPVKNISSWGNRSTFKAGVTYSGLPYGQPVRAKYVPWAASLEEFIEAVNDSGSLMYTSRSSYNRSAPYYSCDCSSFVSWSWDLPSRQYTRSIGAYATVVESQSIYGVQVGDALCKAGSHVVMVSDVGYRGDKIVYIDIMEQTPPQTKYTRWGEGGTKQLSEFYGKYFGKGYKLIRSKTRDSVQFRPSSVVVIDGNGGEAEPSYKGGGSTSITLSAASVELNIGEEKKLTCKGSASGTPGWSSDKTSVATVDSTGKIKAVAAGTARIKVQVGGVSASAVVYVRPAMVKLKSAAAKMDGSVKLKWKKVKGVSGYEVLRKSGKGAFTAVGTTSKTSFTDTAAAKNTTYTYTVRGIISKADGSKAAGAYNNAGIISRTVLETPELEAVALDGLTSQIVSWKPVNGAEGYAVYRKTKKTKWEKIGSASSTNYKSTGLTPGVKYTYTVRAYFTAGGKQVLGGYVEKGISKKAMPGKPVLESATPSKKKKIVVKWKKMSGISTYKVYRREQNRKKWIEVGTAYKNSYTDKDVEYGKEYAYTVRAIYRAGSKKLKSDYDKTGIAVKLQPGYTSLTGVNSPAAGQASLSWSKSAGTKGYCVYAKTADSDWKAVAKCSAKKKSVTVKGLQSGVRYSFTVRGYWKIKGELLQGDFNAEGMSITLK